ncbi:MAG TPA: alkaline phosphatase D family protein, partial [Tepidisphaeraceae bacterium]
MDSNSAVIWTRTSDPTSNGVGTTDTAATGQAATITGSIYSDVSLSSLVATVHGTTGSSTDFTYKTVVSGLNPGTTYYYRFTNDTSGAPSNVGTFKTAPAANVAAPVHFGFSGDVDGLMRPYISLGNVTAGGAPTITGQKFDFYVNLGDTIYETASTGSAAAAATVNPSTATTDGLITSGATQAQLLTDYHRKYKEQFLPVNSGGQKAMLDFYAAQGNYTLLDNHELGNRQYINGGAPAGPAIGGMPSGGGVDARSGAGNDHNTSGAFMNKSMGFQAVQQAYLDYQPMRDRGVLNTPSDLNSNGTKQTYFAQQWGKNALFVNVDDRSYRDIRLKTNAGADDNGPRADNAARTMLGTTQLAWLKQTLLDAQNAGTPWKFVAVSSPIDQIGPIGGALPGVAVGSDG